MQHQLTRRNLLLLTGAGVAALRPLAAANSDFWDKKPPSEWSSDEIDRLLTRSPWAKEVTAQYAPGQAPSGGYPDSTGYPGGGGGGRSTGGIGGIGGGIGGLGIPGIGGIGYPRRGGNGRGQPRSGQASAFHGTVRWESAQPILDAVKTPLPDVFEGHYVLAVTDIPLLDSRSQGTRGEDDDRTSRTGTDEDLENLKSLTSLQVKGKDLVQAGIVRRQVGTARTILFGFSKELLPIDKRDGEIAFSSRLGGLIVKTRFSPKEMQYHGVLAV
jgi:hypothetical protein